MWCIFIYVCIYVHAQTPITLRNAITQVVYAFIILNPVGVQGLIVSYQQCQKGRNWLLRKWERKSYKTGMKTEAETEDQNVAIDSWTEWETSSSWEAKPKTKPWEVIPQGFAFVQTIIQSVISHICQITGRTIVWTDALLPYFNPVSYSYLLMCPTINSNADV